MVILLSILRVHTLLFIPLSDGVLAVGKPVIIFHTEDGARTSERSPWGETVVGKKS